MIRLPQVRRLSQLLAAAFMVHQAVAADDNVAAALISVDIVGIAPLHGQGIERRLLPYPVQAASDSLVQQMLGHGIAAKLSQRLGEGMLNGLLTARLGLAAIDVTRPLPFAALPPPKLSDLASDLLRRKEEEE